MGLDDILYRKGISRLGFPLVSRPLRTLEIFTINVGVHFPHVCLSGLVKKKQRAWKRLSYLFNCGANNSEIGLMVRFAR